MSISDELREHVRTDYLLQGYGEDKWLLAIADRIDEEMVELPKDKDGVPIHICDTVYLDDGRKACVAEIDIMEDREVIICWNGKSHEPCIPSDVTYERPDSWERIADELEEWSEDNRVNGSHDVFERADDLAKRIRRLAKEEERRTASSTCTSVSTCTSTSTSGLTIAYGGSSHDDGFCS